MSPYLKIFGLGALAMLAFAGNSILNRYALIDGGSGAWTFTLIRLISGAVMLAILSRFQMKEGSWRGALMLLVYAAGFSYAYLALGAGLGALILFTAVQFTMLGQGLVSGERLSAVQWIGTATAFSAMVWLLAPGANRPDLWAVAAMIAAGMGWGVYSLLGRGVTAPLFATTGNFVRAALIAIALSLPVFWVMPETVPNTSAIIAALTSGAITSGIGYAIWYAALPGLSRMQAGIMQLSVPAIAALGGVVFLGEILTSRLLISTSVILMGVGIATLVRPKSN